jgi:sirohydrochlorin cobaltochelatase
LKIVVVLAMHGSPPLDFPREEMREYFQLQAREHQHPQPGGHSPRLKELETRMRNYPRNESNDPFWKGSRELAAALEKACGLPVVLGYNEFCAPSLDEALDQAAAKGAHKIIVATPMMTRGGEHAERDIPAAIDGARRRHPGLTFIYAWPFNTEDVAEFLAKKLKDMPELG